MRDTVKGDPRRPIGHIGARLRADSRAFPPRRSVSVDLRSSRVDGRGRALRPRPAWTLSLTADSEVSRTGQAGPGRPRLCWACIVPSSYEASEALGARATHAQHNPYPYHALRWTTYLSALTYIDPQTSARVQNVHPVDTIRTTPKLITASQHHRAGAG